MVKGLAISVRSKQVVMTMGLIMDILVKASISATVADIQ
jgi:hypothetical protein